MPSGSLFKLKPFLCPNCEHSLMVDRIKLIEENTWEANDVFDHTRDQDPELKYDPRPGSEEYRAFSRLALVREIIYWRSEFRKESAKKYDSWWKRTFG